MAQKMTIDEQVATLMQGTEYGDEGLKTAMAKELKERLLEAEKEGRPLRVYGGFDPRTTDLHLGHSIPMSKLRQFQDMGHDVSFVVGTYTSLIGDPSDKDELRPQLTPEGVEENARSYAEQAFRVLDKDKTTVRYNAEWLSELTFADLIELASHFTLQQFLTRENFRKRWDDGDPVFLHETFYAIMQAYDAYTLKADVQVGGSDQLFNIVTAGRKLMTALGEKPNIGMTLGILPGTDGVIRMSKSLGNHIPLNTDAKDMFGKIMSVPDIAMPDFMRLLSRWPASKVEGMIADMDSGKLHPRDAKMEIAERITGLFYSEAAAEVAKAAFVDQFQKGNAPDEMPERQLGQGDLLVDVLVEAGLVSSKSEARRMVKQKAVRLDGETLEDANMELDQTGVLQVGKRRFLRLTD